MPDACNISASGRAEEELVQSQGHVISDEEMKDLLSEELNWLLFGASDEEFDASMLEGVLDALDELDPLPEDEPLDTEAGLRRLHERLAAQSSAEGKPVAGSSIISSEIHRVNRGSAWKILLVAAILALFFAAPVQGNLNLFKLLTGRTSEVFHIGAADVKYAQITKRPLAEDETRYYESVQDMLDAFGITAPLFPTWVPERFENPDICALSTPSGIHLYINYSTSNDIFLMMQASEIDATYSQKIESNQIDGQIIKINNTNYYLIADINAEKATWQNGTLDCFMHGSVSEEEMQQMITSIYGGF